MVHCRPQGYPYPPLNSYGAPAVDNYAANENGLVGYEYYNANNVNNLPQNNPNNFQNGQNNIQSAVPNAAQLAPLYNLPVPATNSETSQALNVMSNSGTSGANTMLAGNSQNELNNGYNLAPVIHKHVYVHAPPPEEETENKVQNPYQAAPPQKHYKIIFIKTPTPTAQPTQNVLVPQSEEKTIVYVLVKKPDDIAAAIPTTTPTLPSKPEVYYIKYRNKAQRAPTDSGYATNNAGGNGEIILGSNGAEGNNKGKESEHNSGLTTGLIQGGSISDALLNAGSMTTSGNEAESSTTPTYTTAATGVYRY